MTTEAASHPSSRTVVRRATADACFDALTAAAALSLGVFVVVRAIRVPLTFDEAGTYQRYLAADFVSIFDFELATNHFLNTVLAKACYLAFGDTEVALRAPNLVGYAMYAGFSVLLLRALTRRVIMFAGFLLLNLNPYLLDFFGLCRGYGLSLGFLMGALFFFFRFLGRLSSGQAACRQLSLSLGFACAAVLANLTILNVFIAIAGVSIAVLAGSNVASNVTAAGSASGATTRPASRGRYAIRCVPGIAAIFTALVLSQDVHLSQRLYEPVAVTLFGLTTAELDQVEVGSVGINGKPTPFRRDDGTNVWRQGRLDVVRVRVEVPLAAARDLEGIDVMVGSRRFEHDRRGGAWLGHDEEATWVLESAPGLSSPPSRIAPYRRVINWAGDGPYAVHLLAYTAVALGVLALWALLLKAVGRTAGRLRLLTGDQWQPFQSSAVWLAALAGVPLYVLSKNGALYFGGTRGLVDDTFVSLIHGSLYGEVYHAAQRSLVTYVLVAALAVLGAVLVVTYRRGHAAQAVRAAAVLGLLIIASLAIVAEALLFNTPYPYGRTALFYIPLYLLFVILTCEAAARLGRTGATIATGALLVATCLSMYHFAVSSNTTYAWEWQKDAATKQMMDDLAFVASIERPGQSRLVLGVDWTYVTVAAFYAKKQTAYSIEVIVLPSARAADFLYLDEGNRSETMRVIRRYRISRSVLASDATR